MTGGLVRAWLGKCEYPCNLVWVLDKKSKDQQMLVLSVLYNFFDYVDMVVQGIQAYRYRRSHHRIGKEQDAGREKLYSIVLILKRWGKANSSLFWFDTNAPRCIDSLISSRLFYFLRITIKGGRFHHRHGWPSYVLQYVLCRESYTKAISLKMKDIKKKRSGVHNRYYPLTSIKLFVLFSSMSPLGNLFALMHS